MPSLIKNGSFQSHNNYWQVDYYDSLISNLEEFRANPDESMTVTCPMANPLNYNLFELLYVSSHIIFAVHSRLIYPIYTFPFCTSIFV